MTPFIEALCKTLDIYHERHVAEARRQTRLLAEEMGFPRNEVYYLATCATELCNNLLVHAGGGQFVLRVLASPVGIQLETLDRGSGISNVALALTEGFSTAGGLGGGLPGVQRMTDELLIAPREGGGTVVTAKKWLIKPISLYDH